MTANQALHQFFSQFGMTAYRDTSVPDHATLPYLTYQYAVGGFGKTLSITVNMWFYTESEAVPDSYAERLNNALANGGANVLFDGGSILIKRGTPFCIAQNGQDDKNIKLRCINVSLQYLSNY